MKTPLLIIPAAGKGTRMGDLCKNTPKFLLQVNGVPIIRHVWDFWAPMAEQVVVVVAKGRAFDVWTAIPLGNDTNRVLEQPEPRGVNDAILCALRDVRCPPTFIVALGDCLFRGEFDHSDLAAVKDLELCGMAVRRAEEQKDDWERSYSLQVYDDVSGICVSGLTEKPLLGLGAYWLTWKAMGALQAARDKSITEAFGHLIEHGEKVHPVTFGGAYRNCTYPSDIERAWP